MSKRGETREVRDFEVWRIPVGPEDTRGKVVEFKGPRVKALEFYEWKRQTNDTEGAFVVVDGFNRPVYACS